MFYPTGKQAYKLELQKRWRIHDIFHMLLLEQNITKKEQIDKKVIKLKFETGKSKKYKVEAILDSAVYVNKTKGYLSGLYYLLAFKKTLRKKILENHYLQFST